MKFFTITKIHNVSFILLFTKLISSAQCDVLAALSGLKTLLHTELLVIKSLGDYISAERDRIHRLKRYSERLKGQQKRSENNQEHLENHFFSVLMLKSLTIDHDFMINLTKNITGYKRSDAPTYPTFADLEGAIGAITRLESTYRLNITDLAQGNLKGHFSTPLTASDCHEIGILLIQKNDYSKALLWFIETLEKYQLESDAQQIHAHQIIGKLITCYERSGLQNYTNKLVNLRISQKSRSYFLALLREELALTVKKKWLTERALVKSALKKPLGSKRRNKDELMSLFTSLCRGEMTITPRISQSLSCRYLTESHPFLLLARVKLEELYSDPSVIMFHDVISQAEILHLKTIAAPNLTRANIVIHPQSAARSNTGRLSKISWLADTSSDIVARISRRVSHLTGLDVRSSEELQVAEYGVGGHFLPHHDYPKLENSLAPPNGGRISTVMFYLSDVEEGGATVFTELGLTVHPQRGSALMWNNLHSSGIWHQGAYHGGCPVLKGNKWVANKWLHEAGQELRKPCPIETADKRYSRQGFNYRSHISMLIFHEGM